MLLEKTLNTCRELKKWETRELDTCKNHKMDRGPKTLARLLGLLSHKKICPGRSEGQNNQFQNNKSMILSYIESNRFCQVCHQNPLTTTNN